MLVWPNIGLTVYAEDLITQIPDTGADVPNTRYYRDLKASFILLDYDPLWASGDAVEISPVTRVAAALVGQVSPQMFGAVGDGVADDTAAIQAALSSSAREVRFPGDKVYRTTAPLTVTKDCVLSTDSSGDVAAAKISYEGSGFALIVNGPAEHLGDPGAASFVRHFEMRKLAITAPIGSGIMFGSTINPDILIDNVTVSGCTGYAMSLGGSVYFFKMQKCSIINTRGVIAREACDLFTVDQCSFGFNTDYDLYLACPTFQIRNSDFELNHGDYANIAIATTTATTGYGSIENCRFGPESVGVQIAPHDIHFAYVSGGVYKGYGVRLLNNRHFSALGGFGQKISPILLDVGLANFETRGEYFVNYSSEKLFSTTTAPPAGHREIVAAASIGANRVTDLHTVPAGLMPMFDQFAQNELKAIVCESASDIDPYVVLSSETTEPLLNVPRGMPRVYPSITASSGYERHVIGVALLGTLANNRVSVATQGSIITTDLNTSGATLKDPVYMGASGKISLTPATIVKRVGYVESLHASASRILIDVSDPPQYATMPTFGKWFAGDRALKSAPTVAGPALSQYVVRGWNRLTTGTGHVLGTDWVEARELTGT